MKAHLGVARSLSDIAVRDEAKEVLADARPQASKNRRRIRWNTLRIFRDREQSRCREIVRRSRKVNVGQAPRQTKLIHSVAATAAHVHDSQVLPELLHGQETGVWGDAAYSGQRDVLQQHAPQAQSFIQAKAHRHRPLTEEERAKNRTKSKVRAKVEQAFLVIKRIFGWATVRYRGLAKNPHWLYISGGLANLYMVRRRLVAET